MSLPFGVFFTGGRLGVMSSSLIVTNLFNPGTLCWWGWVVAPAAGTGRGWFLKSAPTDLFLSARAASRIRGKSLPLPEVSSRSYDRTAGCRQALPVPGAATLWRGGYSSGATSRAGSCIGTGRRTGSEVTLRTGETLVWRTGWTGFFIAVRTAAWTSGFLTICVSPLTGAGISRVTGTLAFLWFFQGPDLHPSLGLEFRLGFLRFRFRFAGKGNQPFYRGLAFVFLERFSGGMQFFIADRESLPAEPRGSSSGSSSASSS